MLNVCLFSAAKKRVLPHGQSCDLDDEGDTKNTLCCSSYLCCRFRCKRRQKRALFIPTTESSAETFPAEHPTKSFQHRACSNCKSTMRTSDSTNIDLDKEHTPDRKDEHPALVKEELNTKHEISCPICIESFHIGEQVVLSSLGYCQHNFHYACLLEWALLGNLECPVCKQEFWSPRDTKMQRYLCFVEKLRSASETRTCTFCVEHGLLSSE